MKNKKGFELSINFVVIIILSLVVFGFGLKLLKDIFTESTKLIDFNQEDIDKQIGDFTCQPGELVCVSPRIKRIDPGELGVFGIKIANNMGSDKLFRIIVYPDNEVSYPNYDLGAGNPVKRLGFGEKDGAQVPILIGYNGCTQNCIPNTNHLDVIYKSEDIQIKNQESVKTGIGIQVPKTGISSGTYVFDVIVVYDKHNDGSLNCDDIGLTPNNDLDSCLNDMVKPARVVNHFYGGQVYKLNVEVP